MKPTNMIAGSALLALALLAQVAAAHPCPHRHRMHPHAATPRPAPVVQTPAPAPAGNAFANNFELVGGFRWDRAADCPSCTPPAPSCAPPPPHHPHQEDPVFLGAQLRVPIAPAWTLQGRLDRDVVDHGELVQAAHWNGAVSLHWAPFRH